MAQPFDLPHRRFRGVQAWRSLAHPFGPKPPRLRDIAQSNAGINEDQPLAGLDQETMTNQPRALEQPAGPVDGASPDRTHRAGIEMMDVHDSSLKILACLPPFKS